MKRCRSVKPFVDGLSRRVPRDFRACAAACCSPSKPASLSGQGEKRGGGMETRDHLMGSEGKKPGVVEGNESPPASSAAIVAYNCGVFSGRRGGRAAQTKRLTLLFHHHLCCRLRPRRGRAERRDGETMAEAAALIQAFRHWGRFHRGDTMSLPAERQT